MYSEPASGVLSASTTLSTTMLIHNFVHWWLCILQFAFNSWKNYKLLICFFSTSKVESPKWESGIAHSLLHFFQSFCLFYFFQINFHFYDDCVLLIFINHYFIVISRLVLTGFYFNLQQNAVYCFLICLHSGFQTIANQDFVRKNMQIFAFDRMPITHRQCDDIAGFVWMKLYKIEYFPLSVIIKKR